MNKLESFVELTRLNELLDKQEEEKKKFNQEIQNI